MKLECTGTHEFYPGDMARVSESGRGYGIMSEVNSHIQLDGSPQPQDCLNPTPSKEHRIDCFHLRISQFAHFIPR